MDLRKGLRDLASRREAWALVGLAAFYASVLLMALRPDVSDEYRSYYLERDRSLTLKQRKELPDLLPGEEVLPDSGRVGFIGWSASEGSHRWSEGNESRIYFRLAGVAACRPAIEFEGFAAGAQRTSVELNGTRIWSGMLEGPFRLELATAGLLKTGVNVLVLALPDARAAGSEDPRRLALALHRIRLC